MRTSIAWLAVSLACGNQSTQEPTPTAPTTSATATSAPTASTASIPSATPSAEPSATATAPPAPMKKLSEILATAKSIKLTWRPKLDSNDAKLLDITTAQSLKQIIDAIGADQSPEGPGPSYMATIEMRFLDQGGNPLATISLYASATMSDANKKYGRINVADGTYGGITVAKYEELQKKLKALGVELP